MKLYFSVGKQPVNGYTNIDLSTLSVDFNNLDPISERAECTEIILDEILSYINLPHMPQILAQLITRLRKQGKIIITNLDIDDILTTYINGGISIVDLNYALFGTESIKKTSCVSHMDIQSILINNGLTINSVELLSSKFIIKAQRN